MKPLASLGCDLPLELLSATGRYAGPLAFDADRPAPKAERWLESKFAPWASQILEDWAAGALDQLDAVLFSRGDDSCQRLYYYLCELRRTGEVEGPEPLIFDVGHIPRGTSVAGTVDAVRRLNARLGVTEAALAAAMADAPAADIVPSDSDPLCLLAGTLPPDRRLHEAIEGCGWGAYGETLPENWQRRAPEVEAEAGDSFHRLGQRLHAATIGPRAFFDRVERLSSRIDETGATAVVLWFCEHDEAEVWHAPALRRALDARAIPYLFLARRDWRAADGAIEEIRAFLGELPR
ncbi:MAG: 2-hydroxyacyl-CoA dehydratase [Sphingomonadaceae bacterium]|nr:2-hydroxyacyl-CoA dehydratase [Sphingomonadaceae bacterium]